MNEHEIEDAKHVLDRQHWSPPVVSSLMCLAVLAYGWQDEPGARILMLALFGSTPAFLWFIFLRNRERVQRDIDQRMIEVAEGALTKVRKNRFGVCFISIDGKKIRVPAEFFKDLQEATTATVEYLPESFIALHIKPHYGLHLK